MRHRNDTAQARKKGERRRQGWMQLIIIDGLSSSMWSYSVNQLSQSRPPFTIEDLIVISIAISLHGKLMATQNNQISCNKNQKLAYSSLWEVGKFTKTINYLNNLYIYKESEWMSEGDHNVTKTIYIYKCNWTNALHFIVSRLDLSRLNEESSISRLI